MSWDYDQLKAKTEGESHWATYSDLFMVLSLVFLLLYVFSSLRAGTFSLQKQIEYQQLKEENQDLKQQIKVYNTLKDDYLENDALKEDQKVYNKLMSKLKLLKEETDEEKDELRKRAAENEEKVQALNKYQQLVRNVINANMISKARINRRDTVINQKDEVIAQKRTEIKSLRKDIVSKEGEVEQGERQIAAITRRLDNKVKQLQKSYEQKKITKAKMDQQIKKLKEQSEQRVAKLQEKTDTVRKELQEQTSQLNKVSTQLQAAQQTIETKDKEKQKLVVELNYAKASYKRQIQDLQAKHQSDKNEEQKKFEEELKQQQLSAAARLKKIEDFKKNARAKEKEFQNQMAALQNKIQKSNQELAAAEREAKGLKKDVKRLKELANAKKKLAKEIKSNLKKAGIDAQVDANTGDVIISFGREYFNTGSAKLKNGMRKKLEKFMPIYSKSLLSNPKTAKRINSVEIVGFASPTYKGKYVNPVSLNAEDKKAVGYNLDLSYYRARSIFDYIFDTQKMQYKYQKDLLPLVKVTGRSFFTEKAKRDIASGMSHKDFCKKYDCKKAQRVRIKFNLEN